MNIGSIFRSRGVQNFAKLLSANVVAQAIGLLIYPILTRIYSPEDFGLLNLFLGIGNILIVIALADYHYAIVLPKEEEDAASITHLSSFLLICTTLIVGISVCASERISAIFKLPDLAKYYWMMPLYVLTMGGWNILNYWYIRQKKYGRISGYLMSQSTLSAIGKIGFGWAKILQGGMIYSVILSPVISLITSIFSCQKETLSPLYKTSISNIRTQAKAYRNFPCFVLPRSFINVLAGQLPILLLTPFFGEKYVGLLAMAILLGYTPIGTISRAIYQVLYKDTTERVHQSAPIGDILKRFIGYGSLVIIPLFVVIGIWLPEITSWLLGEEWRIVGHYIRWMLPWLYISLFTGSTCYLSDVFMKQKIGLLFEILLAVCRAAGLGIGIYFHNFEWAIAAYSIGTAIAVAAQQSWLISLVRKYDKQLKV